MKNKIVAALFAFFLGSFGAHKFYLDRPGMGILYLLFFWTGIPGFVAFIEGIVLLATSEQSFNLTYNQSALLLSGQQAPPQVIIQQQFGHGHGAPGHAGQAGAGAPGVDLGKAAGPPGYGQPGTAHPPGPAGASPQLGAGATGLSMDQAISQLERLNELRISGAITEQEFQMKKAALLGTTSS